MLGESSRIEFDGLVGELLKLLSQNEEALLKEKIMRCSNCSGAQLKSVYKSPEAYRIGQLLQTLRLRNFL
ncbi:hypothetical protein FDI24_gp194 [Acidovorax phage ACP17]|uniref:Uncharacterized protein n=1 Tax=Acidovorax phage ACP17 TaxID=2010329 RepID=A0A223AJ14_9CAUD|nr:hypothetical protein FDI24_gp194 [Acidovorax phage ACP17]ASS33943.1 hypothetical protein [Acidovorax phage ACP17]